MPIIEQVVATTIMPFKTLLDIVRVRRSPIVKIRSKRCWHIQRRVEKQNRGRWKHKILIISRNMLRSGLIPRFMGYIIPNVDACVIGVSGYITPRLYFTHPVRGNVYLGTSWKSRGGTTRGFRED